MQIDLVTREEALKLEIKLEKLDRLVGLLMILVPQKVNGITAAHIIAKSPDTLKRERERKDTLIWFEYATNRKGEKTSTPLYYLDSLIAYLDSKGHKHEAIVGTLKTTIKSG